MGQGRRGPQNQQLSIGGGRNAPGFGTGSSGRDARYRRRVGGSEQHQHPAGGKARPPGTAPGFGLLRRSEQQPGQRAHRGSRATKAFRASGGSPIGDWSRGKIQ